MKKFITALLVNVISLWVIDYLMSSIYSNTKCVVCDCLCTNDFECDFETANEINLLASYILELRIIFVDYQCSCTRNSV